MFVFTIPTIRAAIQTHLPHTAAAVERITASPDALDEVWGQMDATSIDYGIMERCDHILTIPCDPGWSDLGAWTALDSVLPSVEGGKGHGAPVVAVEAEGCTVFAPGKAVALVGVADLVVVDTEDALLVMSKDRAQELRQVLTRLDNEAPHLT
jgi:mannose-1-phosphate guanylyltransferase